MAIQDITDHFKSHKGVYLQVGIGILELSAAYLLWPSGDSSAARSAAAGSLLGLGISDTMFGLARNLPNSNLDHPREFYSIITRIPEATKALYRELRRE